MMKPSDELKDNKSKKPFRKTIFWRFKWLLSVLVNSSIHPNATT